MYLLRCLTIMADLGHHEYNYSNTNTGFFWYLISDSIIANYSNHKTKLAYIIS